jgi:organizing structure protein 2
MTWELFKSRTQDGREKVSSGVVGVVGKLQDATGLKLQEGLGWSSEKVKVAEKAVETKAEAVADIVEKGVQDTKEAIEEKVDEIKRLV